jgi:hypothetical protein
MNASQVGNIFLVASLAMLIVAFVSPKVADIKKKKINTNEAEVM